VMTTTTPQQSTVDSVNEMPLMDSLLGLLSPPASASINTPLMMDTASPALLELLSPVNPPMLSPADVFRTPHLPTIDEEEGDDEDDVPLAAVMNVSSPAQSNKRKREADDGEDDGPKKFHCDICNRAFSRQYNMRTHRLTHDPESGASRPFSCDHCHRTFTRKHDLTRHNMLHDDSKAFKCKTCGRGFARLDVLERHARAVHKA
ncbi:hypothetical protein FBU59_006946, partial [Linderina macrospora]